MLFSSLPIDFIKTVINFMDKGDKSLGVLWT